MPTATDYIDRREIKPIAKTTAEWDMVEAQVRERSFFMAGVENARILQEFKDAAREIAAGNLTTNEARKRLRAALRGAGYEPADHERGGIHDLSSRRRMEVTLKTNVEMARGWMQHEIARRDKSNPGQRLIRTRKSRQPRNWAERWKAAAEAVNWQGVARGGQMVALIESPIWAKLSRFGNPYPPFDFGSGMGVDGVSYADCEKLGLLDAPQPPEQEPEEYDPEYDEAAEELTAPPATDGGEILLQAGEAYKEMERLRETPHLTSDRLDTALDSPMTHEQHKQVEAVRTSLNNHLEADVSKLDRKVVQTLLRQMGALVMLKGDKIVCTDLNGDKEFTPQEMADIWKRGLPEWVTAKQADGFVFTNIEKASLVEWVRTNDAYDKRENRGTVSNEMRMAFRMLLRRLISKPSEEVLYRGMGWDSFDKLEQMRDLCRKNGNTYTPAPWKEADSFTSSESMAELYAEKQGKKRGRKMKYQAILKVIGHHSAKDMRPLYDAITTVQQDPETPTVLEAELFFIEGTKFEVVSVQRYDLPDGGKRDIYTLREL